MIRQIECTSLHLNHCSQAAAAWLLAWDPRIIPGLFRDSQLALQTEKGQTKRVTRESVTIFSDTWASIASIAASALTTSVRLERLADAASTERLVLEPFNRRTERSSFVRKANQGRLLAEDKRHPSRKSHQTLFEKM